MSLERGRSAADVAEVAQRLAAEKSVLVVTHEAPDGDALGSVSAFLSVADALGIEAQAYIPGTTDFPEEYLFLPYLSGILRGPAPKVAPETTVYLLDCASLSRSNGHQIPEGPCRVNIDHHQDNPGYGELNLVDPMAPSTTAILFEVFKAMGTPMSADTATALYVGLVTDTGRFQYSNTTPTAHRMAAELQDLGVDVNAVYRAVYESTPLAKFMLLQRALVHLEVRLEGAMVVSRLDRQDFLEAGASEGHAEGIIDTLRRVQGVKVAALVRELPGEDGPRCKASLRSTDGSVNVADIAARQGGGGHVRAAGFTCGGTAAEVMDWIEEQVRTWS